jgi:hypothetical protein
MTLGKIRGLVLALGSVFGLAEGAWGDVTMRHTMALRFDGAMPPIAVETIQAQLETMLSQGTMVRIKGDRVSASMGPLTSITDYAKGTITVLDPKTKRVATSTIAEYARQLGVARKTPAGSAEVQRAFEGLKVDVSTEKSGQTQTIQGMAAEERVVKLAMQIPGIPGQGMRVEIHVWMASPEEMQSRPALRELAAYSARAKNGMDPLELLTKAFSAMPAVSEKVRGPFEEMVKGAGGQLLQMRADYFLPALGEGDASMKLAMELAELSTAPIAEAAFETPAGYRTAPMGELLKALFPKAAPAQ